MEIFRETKSKNVGKRVGESGGVGSEDERVEGVKRGGWRRKRRKRRKSRKRRKRRRGKGRVRRGDIGLRISGIARAGNKCY
ncbi:hypothetical protein ACFQMJ_18520 [Cohnella cellulosilytica]|uniref:Uncharacterized protein n=1 Tax=Cohnella cellulosilytica TaxID=986710 RepID=A0ABW2FB89_9BACL